MSNTDREELANCSSWLLLLVTLVAMLPASCRSTGSYASTTTQREMDIVSEPQDHAKNAAFRAATNSVTSTFKPSLETKENVDFLLIPALLVRGVLSDSPMIASPSE